MDLVQATRQFLAVQTDLTALLGNTSPLGLWLWQWRQPFPVETTGKAGVVLSQSGSWTQANTHNTAQFPRLLVEILADSDRDADGNVTTVNAETKVLAVAQVLSRHLHIVDGSPTWGTLRIVSSTRLSEASPRPVPGAAGLAYGALEFGVTVG